MIRKPVPSIAAPASPHKPLPDLPFPTDRDLLVTTHNAVSVWEASTNVHKIYRSVHDCIGAATRSQTGLLTVADGRVVVIEAKGSTRTRYHLKSGDGNVNVLAYANNLQHLFFSTTLRHAVQRYSIVEDRLLDWFCLHPSPPTVLAISATSRYAISASRHPPTIYLSLLSGQEPKHLLVKPHASVAGVTAASFHPGTEEYFLLAYVDGTVSLHTASRIELLYAHGSDGSVGFLKRAHRVTNQPHYRHASKQSKGGTIVDTAQVGAKSVGITAAAFVKGCKLRVVTAAGDGKCRMIDFERGAQIIRTWSIASSCTSLAIYSPPSVASELMISKHIIAIGRADGHVSLFDYAGILREEKLIDAAHRGIIGLEWTTRLRSEDITADKGDEAETVRPSFTQVEWKFARPVDLATGGGNHYEAGLSRSPFADNAERIHSPPTSPRTLTTPISNRKSKPQWPLSPSSSVMLEDAKEPGPVVDKRKSPVSSSPLLRSLREGRLKPLSPRGQESKRGEESVQTHATKVDTQRPASPAIVKPSDLGDTDPCHTDVVPSDRKPETEQQKILDSTRLEGDETSQGNKPDKLETSAKEPSIANNSIPAEEASIALAVTPQPSASSILRRKGMPGSWVSEGDLTAVRTQERQRPKGPRPQPPTPVARLRSGSTVQIVQQPLLSSSSPERFQQSELKKGPQSLNIERERLLDETSACSETDAELSPVRRHQANRHRRLRRMTQHDNLALAEFKDRRDRRILPLRVDDNRPLPRSHKTRSPPLLRSSSSYSVADSQAPHTNTPPSRTRPGQDTHVPEKSSHTKPPRYYAQFFHRSKSKSPPDHGPRSIHGRRNPSDKPLPTEKSLPLLPPGFDQSPSDLSVSPSQNHECDCADVVREEMALVRAEIASLRKALWVFGSRVESMPLSGSGVLLPSDGRGGVGLIGDQEILFETWRRPVDDDKLKKTEDETLGEATRGRTRWRASQR